MKTKKAVSKRFQVTASGKLKRQKQGRKHILTKKSRNKKRELKKPTYVASTHERLYKQLIGA